MKQTSGTLGAVASAFAFMFFTCFDTLAKFLSQSCSVFLVMAVSYSVATLIMVGAVLVGRKKTSFGMERPGLHLIRGITQIVGQSCVYMALPHISLAEFYVVIFMMPAMVIVMSSLTLKEPVAPYVWGVLAVNFIGVLIALRPDQGISAWTLVLFIGTVVLSCSLVLLRNMMRTESSQMTSLTATGFLALGAIIPAVMSFEHIDMEMAGWMVLGGVLVSCVQVLLAMAYKLAPTAYAGPPQFLQLVYGAIAGYLVFGDVPSLWIYAGGAVVVMANMGMMFWQPRAMKP